MNALLLRMVAAVLDALQRMNWPGAHVVIAGRKMEKLETVKAEIEEDGGMVTAVSCNIKIEEQVTALFDQVLANHSQIHGFQTDD